MFMQSRLQDRALGVLVGLGVLPMHVVKTNRNTCFEVLSYIKTNTCFEEVLCYMESSPFSWEGARPATARGAEPYRSHVSFEIGGSRQLAARSRSETVPFGRDTGRPPCRNGRCPPHEKNISRLHSLAFSKAILWPGLG